MDIVERINKLLERAANAASSESEITAAFKIAERLMREHGVTEDQLLRDRSSKTTGVVTRVWVSPRKVIGPILYTLNAVASMTDTRLVLIKGEDTRATFVGYAVDADLAVYLTDLIENAMRAEYTKYYASPAHPHGLSQKYVALLKKSFLIAMANRIRSRIVDSVAEKATAMTRGTGTDIVVMKREIVGGALESFFPQRSVTKHRKKRVDLSAYQAGLAAGDRTNITTGIPEYA
jgi:Protein of unknown function (DUF2786)